MLSRAEAEATPRDRRSLKNCNEDCGVIHFQGFTPARADAAPGNWAACSLLQRAEFWGMQPQQPNRDTESMQFFNFSPLLFIFLDRNFD